MVTRAITRCARQELLQRGFTVIDGALDEDTVTELREEIELLDSAEWLQPSPSLLKSGGSETLIKHGIRERSLVPCIRARASTHLKARLYSRAACGQALRGEICTDEGTMMMAPTLASIWKLRDELVGAFRDNCAALEGLTKLDQVKVAIIRDGGCFPVHTDTDPRTGRSLSVTLYLNESHKAPSPPRPRGPSGASPRRVLTARGRRRLTRGSCGCTSSRSPRGISHRRAGAWCSSRRASPPLPPPPSPY